MREQSKVTSFPLIKKKMITVQPMVKNFLQSKKKRLTVKSFL
jgi:hypothetical protein